jgi:phosphoribosylformylglycinamidine synthase
MAKFKIEITYKPGVLDSEGNATLGALKTLGFHVSDVKSSKVYTIETSDDVKKVEEMCRKLLANPIIQDYSIKKP